MWELIHKAGCQGICWYRTSKPELNTPMDEKDSFNLDGTPIQRTQNVICQSCGKALGLNEVHPNNWREVVE